MQRLLADVSWALYVSGSNIPPVREEPPFQKLLRQLRRKLFGVDHSLMIVVEENHPLIPDFACAILRATVKKFQWDRNGNWLFLSVHTHEKSQLEELKDRFICISNQYPSHHLRSKLERIGQ